MYKEIIINEEKKMNLNKQTMNWLGNKNFIAFLNTCTKPAPRETSSFSLIYIRYLYHKQVLKDQIR